jgi:hypothetical protein
MFFCLIPLRVRSMPHLQSPDQLKEANKGLGYSKGQNLRGAVKLNRLKCALVSQADDAANDQNKRG